MYCVKYITLSFHIGMCVKVVLVFKIGVAKHISVSHPQRLILCNTLELKRIADIFED